ncbi:MAG: hypothetical protein PHN61_12235 [Methanothrix sp.]|nr:hypothetical protein [Methanothrix sp.]
MHKPHLFFLFPLSPASLDHSHAEAIIFVDLYAMNLLLKAWELAVELLQLQQKFDLRIAFFQDLSWHLPA